MKKFNDYMKSLGVKKIYFFALFFAIGLLVAGFILPPVAQIHRSVLIGVGEIIVMVDAPIVIAILASTGMSAWLDWDDKKVGISSPKETEEEEKA